MKKTTDMDRLAEAVTHVVTAITEIVDERIREVAGAAEQSAPIYGRINKPTPAERWVGKKEAAEHLKISLRTLYTLMGKGVIPYMRIGSRGARFKLSDVDEATKRRLGVEARY